MGCADMLLLLLLLQGDAGVAVLQRLALLATAADTGRQAHEVQLAMRFCGLLSVHAWLLVGWKWQHAACSVRCWDVCFAFVSACLALPVTRATSFKQVAALALLQALLSGVPRGRLLLLDLFADEHPVWSRTACLYGHPFIWCMLHNFGGNLEMYGALPAVAEGVAAALDAAQGGMVGVGMAPEGIEQNPAVYEFMAEMAFKGRAAEAATPGGLAAWFAEYAQRRYAGAGALPASASAAVQGAWQLLARSVYSCRDELHNTVCDVPTSRPGLSRSEIMGWGLGPHLWYNVGDVRAAWELLLQAASACPQLAAGSSSFVYDLLDVSRELMSKVGPAGVA
jgi:hypothetical protein